MTTIDELLTGFEKTNGKLLIKSNEREQLTVVLQSVFDFARVIGMQDCFEQHFGQVLLCVHSSKTIITCLDPENSRYCPDMQKALKLFILIIALQNKCATPDQIDSQKIASLLDLKSIEKSIEKNIKRDRSVVASLMFFYNLLNQLVYQDARDSYIKFTKTDFDIDEILVTESSLMALLGTFQLLREIKEKSPPKVKDDDDDEEEDDEFAGIRRQLFKLYYLYYSDVYFCLDHAKFTFILDGFLSHYMQEGGQLKFFYGFMEKAMKGLKATDLLDNGSFYREKLLHPFEMMDDFYNVPYTFFARIQKEKTDYIVNPDKYMKDLIGLLYYAWDESDYAYVVATRYAQGSEVSAEEVKKFCNDLFEIILNTYHETGMLPTTSLLSFFAHKAMETGPDHTTDMAASLPFLDKFLSADMLGGAFDKMIDVVKTNIGNETIANLLNHGMLKNAITNWVQGAGSSVGSSVHSGISDHLPTINFSRISTSVLYFWKTFNKSHDLKNMALQGKGNEIVDQFVGAIKNPAMNLINKGIEKVPYSSFINSNNVGQAMGVFLGSVQSFIGAKETKPDKPFTSGQKAITDFTTTQGPPKGPTKPEDAF